MTAELKIAALMQEKTVELYAKGFTHAQASAAIKRARGWADTMSQKLSPGIRSQAYYDFFKASLDDSEEWLSNMKRSMTSGVSR